MTNYNGVIVERSEQIMREIELLFKVAQMYYEQGLTQKEIGDKLFISRSNISRLLKQAEEAGIVEINVHYPFERKRRYEIEFQKRFKLEEIRIVDSGDNTAFDCYTATTKLAASYVNMQLNNNSILALTCGNSICGMVHELRPRKYLPDMQVVPLMGSIESSNVIIDGHYLVRQVAEIYGCRHYYIMSPFCVDDEIMCQSLMKRPTVVEALTLAENATMMCTGIGHDMKASYMSKENEKLVLEKGAVGYIAGYYFDSDGKIIDIPEIYSKMVCAGIQMFDIPLRCAVVADAEKAPATLAALRGGLVNVLITNTMLANKILDLDERRKRKGQGG